MEVLATHGADVNAQDENGWTALHYAVRDDHLDVVDLLLAAGADRSIKNDKGLTPRMNAAEITGPAATQPPPEDVGRARVELRHEIAITRR